MHEVSIATSIVEIALNEADKAGASRITQVEVEIGSLAGVETEALLFAWDLVTRSTPADHSELVIHQIQATARCLDCSHEFGLNHFLAVCPQCQGQRYELIRGKELRAAAITVE